MSHFPGFQHAGTFVQDNLLAGDFPLKTRSVTLLGGSVYKRGTVLQPTADDGEIFEIVTIDSEAKYLLLEDVDATAGNHVATVAMTGEFNARRITFGEGATYEGVAYELERHSIYLRGSVE